MTDHGISMLKLKRNEKVFEMDERRDHFKEIDGEVNRIKAQVMLPRQQDGHDA